LYVSYTYNNGETPLFNICVFENEEIVKLLANLGADINKQILKETKIY